MNAPTLFDIPAPKIQGSAIFVVAGPILAAFLKGDSSLRFPLTEPIPKPPAPAGARSTRDAR